jgi:superfamily II helicase
LKTARVYFIKIILYGNHAGMDLQDRKFMEELFASGDLPVLGKPNN